MRAGQPLLAIDDFVQRATTEQARLLAEGAMAQLKALRAEPRRETLAVAAAQVVQAQANLTTLARQRDKLARSASLDPRSVSQNSLDSAIDTARAAEATLAVARRQYLISPGPAPGAYDIQNQEAQVAALTHAYEAGQGAAGEVCGQGADGRYGPGDQCAKGGLCLFRWAAYDTYTQMNLPVAVLGQVAGTLQVRCYVDEILLSRIPRGGAIRAQMSVRGADYKVPLEFVRIQPYVTPKIELSNQRQEQVDLRVLPVIFRFAPIRR